MHPCQKQYSQFKTYCERQVKTIVNTLAAAEAQAEAEEEQRRQQTLQGQQDEPQSQRAPRTMMLPQEMPGANDERPHCESFGLISYTILYQ